MRKCEDFIRSYMEYTKASQSPVAFHFWTCVSTIAAVLKRNVWIDMRTFKWLPNHYILLVSPPGIASKSTSLGIGEGLLRDLQDPTIHFGPNSLTWQSYIDAFAEATEYYTFPDGTVYETNPITSFVSEVGTSLNMKDPGTVNALIDFWDSTKSYKHRTRHGGEEIVQLPCLNLIGATTPAWLQENVNAVAAEGGLMARFTIVYANKKARNVPYPILEIEDELHSELRKHLIHDLDQMHQLRGDIALTQDAYELGIRWSEDHEAGKNRPAFLRSRRFDHYWNRKQTYIHKLAIILAVARGTIQIDAFTLQSAIDIISANESSLHYVYEHIGLVQNASLYNDIVAFISRCPLGVTPTDVFKQFSHQIPKKSVFDEAISRGIATRAWLTKTHPTLGEIFITKENLDKLEKKDAKA